MSNTNDFTSAPNAAPMINATAIWTRFPFVMKSRNSFHIWTTSHELMDHPSTNMG